MTSLILFLYSNMHLSLVASDRSVFDGTISSVTLPTQDGVIGILPGHEPLIGACAPGVIEIDLGNKDIKRFAIGGGIIQTDGANVTIAVDMIDEGSLSAEEAAQKVAEAKAALETYRSQHATVDVETLVALEESLMKAQAQEMISH